MIAGGASPSFISWGETYVCFRTDLAVPVRRTGHCSSCEQHPSCENPIDGIHISAPEKVDAIVLPFSEHRSLCFIARWVESDCGCERPRIGPSRAVVYACL